MVMPHLEDYGGIIIPMYTCSNLYRKLDKCSGVLNNAKDMRVQLKKLMFFKNKQAADKSDNVSHK